MISKPIQSGGSNHVWGSPDGKFRHPFLRLNLDCEFDKYPGVVILADEAHKSAVTIVIDNLHKELPVLLEKSQDRNVIYWCLEENKIEREQIFQGITEHPVYIG
jgi:hypothetical protein